MVPLTDDDLCSDPMRQFQRWHAEACTDEMALATMAPDGTPTCRMVLLKDYAHGGFVFYTDQRSDKAIDIALHAQVSLLFRWPPLRQVRVAGIAQRVTRKETERYWRSRSRESQLSAWASPQSRPVEMSDLERRVERARRSFAGADVPCPPFWGGYRVVARRFEFWQEGPNRLHDRFCYELMATGWRRQRLGP